MPEERKYLASSHIESVQYDKEDSTLQITFVSGDEYTYYGISESLYNDLISADSHGKFYHQNIKGQYENDQE